MDGLVCDGFPGWLLGHCGGRTGQDTGRQSVSLAVWVGSPPYDTPDHIGPRGQPISSGAAVRCDSTGAPGTPRCSPFIYVNMSADACFSALALRRQWQWRGTSFLTGECVPEEIPGRLLSCCCHVDPALMTADTATDTTSRRRRRGGENSRLTMRSPGPELQGSTAESLQWGGGFGGLGGDLIKV